jgi:ABC-type transporter MlaC component
MKALVLSLIFCISSYAFADAASNMVQSTLTQGTQILSLKSPDARNQQMCALVAASMDADYIGQVLLGQYGNSRDTVGINLFYKELPSITTSQMIRNMGSASGASIDVGSDSQDNGDGTYSVDVTLHQSNGSTYDAEIILSKVNGKYLIRDGTYFGISGIDYLGGQMQKQIGQAGSVSAFMKQQMADPNWIECN